jgi:hypothetical protein
MHVLTIISGDLSLLLTGIQAMAILTVDIAVQIGMFQFYDYQLDKH